MPPKPVEIYQGSDWLTYRWSAAQVYDTLDRIRDLCLQMPVTANVESAPGAPRYEVPDDEIADMFGYIVELCDDLAGEIDTLHADIFGILQATLANRWTAFETRLLLRDLRFSALKEAEARQPSHAPPDAIAMLAARIKALIKKIDQ